MHFHEQVRHWSTSTTHVDTMATIPSHVVRVAHATVVLHSYGSLPMSHLMGKRVAILATDGFE